MASALRLAGQRVRVESNGAPCFPPDILPSCIARAGAGGDVGKDHRVAMNLHNHKAVSCPVDIFDWKRCRRQPYGGPLCVATVLHGLSRERFGAVQVNRQVCCPGEPAAPQRSDPNYYQLPFG